MYLEVFGGYLGVIKKKIVVFWGYSVVSKKYSWEWGVFRNTYGKLGVFVVNGGIW